MSSRKRLLFRLLTALAVLGAIEGAARIIFAAKGEPPPVASESLENEWEWARKHLAAGKAVLESDLAHDPALGWVLRPGLRRADLQTDSAGVRSATEVPVAKPPGERRIVFVGDSYTHGHGNKNDETFPHYLDEALPGWSAVNCAVPGYGTDQCVLHFEERGRRYAPDVAVLGFFVRDYSRNVLAFRDYAKPVFASTGAGFELRGPPIPPPGQLYDEYASGRRRVGAGVHSYAWGALGRTVRRLGNRRADATSPGTAVLWHLMDRFQASVKATGASPVWLIIPDDHGLEDRGHLWAVVERLAEEHAARIGLRCLNLAPIFLEEMKKNPAVRIYKPQKEGGHLSAAGNRIVAEALRRFMSECKLLEP